MFFWFLGTATLTVFLVFTDPRFDYRLLLVGAVLPDLIDLPAGQARWAHSLTVAVGALALVMLVTSGRRPIRSLLLGLPIGMLLHLVWDATWANTQVFWWPFSGSWGDVAVMSVERGWWNIPLEVAGMAMLVHVWRCCGLSDPERRRRFWRHGVLTDTRPRGRVIH
jgi:hypothetical protein